MAALELKQVYTHTHTHTLTNTHAHTQLLGWWVMATGALVTMTLLMLDHVTGMVSYFGFRFRV